MATETLYLPSDIPIIKVEISGYAASADPETALLPTGLPRCERADCGLRGERVPDLLGSLEAMKRAEMIATEMGEAEEWRQGRLGPGMESLGHVFHVSLTADIAVPPPRVAIAMARGTGGTVWEKLRPYAEGDDFHGIDLPVGRVIFRHAQDAGHYEERLMVSVPSCEPPRRT